MKKHLNTDAIANELKGASLFFRPSPIAQPRALSESAQAVSVLPKPLPGNQGSPANQSVPIVQPADRSADRSAHRRTMRRAFEFYEDQLDRLLRISLEAKMRGEKGSMSQMVREAVDAYIAKRDRPDA